MDYRLEKWMDRSIKDKLVDKQVYRYKNHR